MENKKPSLTGPDGKGPREWKVPEGDDKKRLTCPDCEYIAYSNPKPIVGAVVTFGDKILLCRRAIEPRKGYWTIPAGYMENNETLEDGAKRETREEACAEIEIDNMLAIYDLPHISQIHVMFRGTMDKPDFAPGIESLEVKLFDWDDIPWNDLAFPITHKVLKYYHDTKDDKVVMPKRETVTPPFKGFMKPKGF